MSFWNGRELFFFSSWHFLYLVISFLCICPHLVGILWHPWQRWCPSELREGILEFSHHFPNIQVTAAFPLDESPSGQRQILSVLFSFPQIACHSYGAVEQLGELVALCRNNPQVGFIRILICHGSIYMAIKSLIFFSQPFSMVDSSSSQHYARAESIYGSFLLYQVFITLHLSTYLSDLFLTCDFVGCLSDLPLWLWWRQWALLFFFLHLN